ncbi:MAG TPA: hypothetical protein VFK78_01705 [Gemmatimonadales bacterium]|nr:hypothetical protein [Gemmatimonadales bacterium]
MTGCDRSTKRTVAAPPSPALFFRVASLACVLVACRSDKPRAPGVTPDGVAVADEGCKGIYVASHPKADALLREYLNHDAAGDFLASRAWLDTTLNCPGRLGTIDSAVVVAAWSSSALKAGRDTTRTVVTYQIVARVVLAGGQASDVEPAKVFEVDTVQLVKTPFGWRIDRPPPHWHLMRASALAHLGLDPAERRILGGAR